MLALRILRALLVVVVVQLSGFTHVLADAIVTDCHEVAGDGNGDGDCADEKSGLDCPPGCPTCHCGHGAVATIPSAATETRVGVAALYQRLPERDLESLAYSGPDLPSLFRPPRSLHHAI